MDMLEKIFEEQKKSQEERGFVFPMTDEVRAAYVKTQTLHCIDELCEMLHEVKGYKEWKRYDYSDEVTNLIAKHKTTEELVDALHFFVNIALGLGIDADDLFSTYMAKHRINKQRLEDVKNYKLDTEV